MDKTLTQDKAEYTSPELIVETVASLTQNQPGLESDGGGQDIT